MTVLMEYDDTDKRAKRLDFWTSEDTRYNSTINRAEGRSALQRIRRQVAAAWAKREAVFRERSYRFGKGDTMAAYLAGLKWSVTVECREVRTPGWCWTDVAVERACVVTRLG